MKGKKILGALLSAVLFISVFAGCGNSNEKDTENADIPTVEATTIGTTVLAQFYSEIASTRDINDIAENLIANEIFSDLAMGTMEVEEGYLNGFDDEISGFTSGVMFAPMIGTIPFVGYIFESDTPDDLANTLEAHAMLNWNICTVADELVIETYENYVFFVMAPNEF